MFLYLMKTLIDVVYIMENALNIYNAINYVGSIARPGNIGWKIFAIM